MNATAINATATATNNWGFKTPIQFRVAYKVAQSYGHQWAQPTWVTVRKPQPNGAIKLVEEPVDTKNPSEAAKAANERLVEENEALGFQLAQHTVPTPKWESGSGTYKVDVAPSGNYTIIVNGMVEFRFDRDGKVLSFKLVPNWITSWCGRAVTGNEAITMAVAESKQWGVNKDLIELFEGDKQFWRTGFVPGSRWCTYERGGILGCGGFVVDLHNA